MIDKANDSLAGNKQLRVRPHSFDSTMNKYLNKVKLLRYFNICKELRYVFINLSWVYMYIYTYLYIHSMTIWIDKFTVAMSISLDLKYVLINTVTLFPVIIGKILLQILQYLRFYTANFLLGRYTCWDLTFCLAASHHHTHPFFW